MCAKEAEEQTKEKGNPFVLGFCQKRVVDGVDIVVHIGVVVVNNDCRLCGRLFLFRLDFFFNWGDVSATLVTSGLLRVGNFGTTFRAESLFWSRFAAIGAKLTLVFRATFYTKLKFPPYKL